MFFRSKSPHLISVDCPKCGSKNRKRVPADWPEAMKKDRICQDCGTRFSPPPPKKLPLWVAALGVFVACLGCLILYMLPDPPDKFPVFRILLISLGMVVLGGGVFCAWLFGLPIGD